MSKLSTIVMCDGPARLWRQRAQLRDDGAGRQLGVFAEKTAGERQPRLPFLQRQEDVARPSASRSFLPAYPAVGY